MKKVDRLRKRKDLIFFALTAFSVGGVLWTLKHIGIGSGFSWSFLQNGYWSAVLELFVLFLALACFVCIPEKKWIRVTGVFFLISFFSFLHAFLLVLWAMCIYAAMIYLTGHLACVAFCKERKNDPLACLMLGLAAIIVLVAACSAVRIGTPARLRIVYLVLLLAECVLCRHHIKEKLLSFFRQDSGQARRCFSADRLLFCGIVTALMVQLGRACVALDYDSLWYGLRSDVMLAPFTGIYDRVISSSLVYTYPKGFEVLSLAFNFSFTESFVYGVNLMLAAMLLYAVYRTVYSFGNRGMAYFAALCCAATPGIMNMAVTAKSDIATLLVQLLMLYFTMKALCEKSGDALMLGVGAAVLSFCFKPSSIVFTTALLVLSVSLFVVCKLRVKKGDIKILTLPVIATAALMLRTILLTGLPMTTLGTSFLQWIGFSYKYPYGENAVGNLTPLSAFFSKGIIWERLPRLYRFFFLPTDGEMDHVIIAWGGILFALCFVLCVLYILFNPKRTWHKVRTDRVYACSLIALLTISVISLGAMLLLKKPDGNYFMLMYALTFVHGAVEMRGIPRTVTKSIYKRVTPLILSGIMLCLLTSWSWTLGFTPIEWSNKGVYNHEQRTKEQFHSLGIDNIVDRLEAEGGKRRVMVLSGQGPLLLSIPAIAESWTDLFRWGNQELVTCAENLHAYFDACGMEYLLIELQSLESDEALSTVGYLLTLAENGYLSVAVDDGNYFLVSVNSVSGPVDGRLCEHFSRIVQAAQQELH